MHNMLVGYSKLFLFLFVLVLDNKIIKEYLIYTV
jgi:hypothetical protein